MKYINISAHISDDFKNPFYFNCKSMVDAFTCNDDVELHTENEIFVKFEHE